MQNPEEIASRLDRLERQLLLSETYSVKAFWQAIDQAYKSILPNIDIKCIICEYEDKRNGYDILEDKCYFNGGILERYKCPNCDAIFGPIKYLELPDSFVDLDYKLLYSRYSESDSSANEMRTFYSLKPAAGQLFLDWGCGGAWSPTVKHLRDGGWDVWGYEPSAETSSEFIVNHRDMISARFDAIFSNNVIEHFRDPVAQFRDFHAILKDGGSMAHSSPCYKYAYAFTRFHSIFLTGRAAETLAERTGFEIVERVQDGEYINVVYAKSTPSEPHSLHFASSTDPSILESKSD